MNITTIGDGIFYRYSDDGGDNWHEIQTLLSQNSTAVDIVYDVALDANSDQAFIAFTERR